MFVFALLRVRNLLMNSVCDVEHLLERIVSSRLTLWRREATAVVIASVTPLFLLLELGEEEERGLLAYIDDW